MKNKETYGITRVEINFAVWRNRKIVVFVSEGAGMERLLEAAQKEAKPQTPISAESVKEFQAITYNTTGSIIIVSTTLLPSVVAHEAVHAASCLLSDCGIEDEEALAYHVGYIVESIGKMAKANGRDVSPAKPLP